MCSPTSVCILHTYSSNAGSDDQLFSSDLNILPVLDVTSTRIGMYYYNLNNGEMKID